MFFPRLLSRTLPLIAVAALFAPSRAPGQGYNTALAGLREDIRILDERTRALNVEIEQLKRENASLRERLARASDSNYVTLSQFNSGLAELDKALRTGDRDLAVQLTQQMERLAKQTQSALDTIAKSASAGGLPAPKINFTEDYPKAGVTYTVQPGDTLSSISARFNSQVNDIRNANKITDPRTLQVGQILFIPQR